MLDRIARNNDRRTEYLTRILGSLAASLFVVWGSFSWWPIPEENGPADINYDVRGQETITIEEIVQTRQEQMKPPPPPPLPPIVVPDDVILEEVTIEFPDDFLALDDTGEDADLAEGATVGDNLSFRADSGPKAVRIVQPDYPDEARRRNIRAELVAEVLVDESGQVSDFKIVERYLVNKDRSEREAVNAIGYGVEEAARAAAERWMFRPAREDGKIVRSYTLLTFNFGI